MSAFIKPLMDVSQSDYSQVSVRLAQSPAELEEAQRVRYQVFYEENGAQPSPENLATGRDFDAYDDVADHLIVIDQSSGAERVVGTYRLFPEEAARKAGGFYSAHEFDTSLLEQSSMRLLELGRSCVLRDYRARSILQLLWQGIADYVADREIDMMFGCASFVGTDPRALAEPLSYLYQHHLAPENFRPRALPERFVDMNMLPAEAYNAKRIFAALPPIIKGYCRLGGTIGDGAVIDRDFNTVDVLVMVKTESLTQRYRNHYERKIKKNMCGSQE